MLSDRLLRGVDWFVPAELRESTASLWQARIFVISHFLGPFSAVAILGYLYRVLAVHDWVLWTLCVLCGSFWTLPFALKMVRTVAGPAVFSFCVLTFVSVFGSFFFGGTSSPFLPWFLTAQLLGFFYLSNRPLLVLGVFGAHLTAFCVAYFVNGSFPERVPISDLSTVGMISVCAATLYSSMMAIYYAYVMVAQSGLQREIKKHLETAAKLRTAKHEAERANEAKAIFLAKMNHQLRTPLNAIIGYSEILLEDAEASEQGADAADLKSINSSGRHLLSLVSDVLYMPRIDSEDVDVNLGPVDLDRCLDEVSATCRNLVLRNGNEFAFEKDGPMGVVQTDETRLRQILINLLGNAGKFTKEGRVALRARRLERGADEQVLISVHDTGIGIPPDAIHSLFKNFNQVNTDAAYGGTGLGLAVSQKLAQLLQGEIVVESRLGQGSEFTLRLPVVSQAVGVGA